MRCQACDKDLTCTSSGVWHDGDFDFNCEVGRFDADSDFLPYPHKPVIDTVDALEAWLDAP